MYNSPYLSKSASGGVSLKDYIGSVVKADLMGKNCKAVKCDDHEQARFTHLETEAKQHMHEVVAEFTKHDSDGDKTLDKKEFMETIQAMVITDDLKDVVKNIISTVDDNNDGQLSYDEVIANADKLGGSTEDFFKDTDVLYIEGDKTDTGMAGRSQFVQSGVDSEQQRRLRGLAN
jgi:Ca2+-binding EF-hand superfamily protein